MNIKNFIDPFNINKILEQIKEVSSFGDNSNNILRIKKEIAKLNDLIEEMLAQNNTYMVELSNTKNLLRDKIKQETRRYAKRQLTWFRKNKNIVWIDGLDDRNKNIDLIISNVNM